jgi:hypothetical protein
VLTDLGALEEVPAVQAGTEHEMAGQERLGLPEDAQDFFVGGTHEDTGG